MNKTMKYTEQDIEHAIFYGADNSKEITTYGTQSEHLVSHYIKKINVKKCIITI